MVRSGMIKVILSLFFLSLSTQYAFAGHEVKIEQLEQANGKLELLPLIDIFIDKHNSLLLDDVLHYSVDKGFKAGNEVGNSLGFSKATAWIRFSIKNNGHFNEQLLLELNHPPIDEITLFSQQKDGSFKQITTGESLPFFSREVNYRSYVFRLPIDDNESKNYFLKISTEGSMQLPLTLWTATAFIGEKEWETLLLGAYFGVMHLLMISMLTVFFMSKDKLFLYYSLYLLSSIVIQASLNGFSFQYVWPNLPLWSHHFTALGLGFTGICSLIFSGAFLQLWGDKHRYLKVIYSLLITVTIVGMLMVLAGEYTNGVILLSLFGLLNPLVILLAAVISMRSGYPPARYFFVAWALFLVGICISALLYFGLIQHSVYSAYSMQLGSFLEVTLLGYALMKRIELLRLEKEQAQIKAQDSLFELNHKLEERVEQRTARLEATNAVLAELASHDSLTGLLNHNTSLDYLKRMQNLAVRHNQSLSVIMLDIDFFKVINDTFGHPVGDKVLVAIANILKKCMRDSDGAGRYGGEEFLLILPETDLDNAGNLASRIQRCIKSMKINELEGKEVTASFGISVFEESVPNKDLVSQADTALYQAKESGRNRVVLFEPRTNIYNN